MVKDGGQVKKKRKTVIASETDGDVDIYRVNVKINYAIYITKLV